MTMFLRNMFTMLVISISSTNLFGFRLTFFIVLPIHFSDINLKTLFPEHRPTLCFGFCVIFSATSSDGKFRTFFLKTNAFAMFIFLSTFCSKNCETLFVKSPVGFGYIQGLLGIFALEVWCGVAIRTWFALR